MVMQACMLAGKKRVGRTFLLVEEATLVVANAPKNDSNAYLLDIP